MRNVNALYARKGRRPRAVLISVEDFQKRFLDRQTEERRREIVDRVASACAAGVTGTDSVAVLRNL